MPFPFPTVPLGALLLCAMAAGPLAAQDVATGFEIELNGAANTDDGNCRLTYVAINRTETAIDRSAYELAIFDAGGTVTQLLSLDFGALVAGKTKILQFDLGGACGDISRIVVNDVLACEAGGQADSGICLDGLTARSRADIQFGI